MNELQQNETKNKSEKRISASVLLAGAIFLVAITVAVTFLVADRIYYNGGLFRRSESVTFYGDDLDTYKVSKFQDALYLLENNFCLEYDINKVIEGAIEGAINSLGDPYTRYIRPGELSDYVDMITGTYLGIGISYKLSDEGMQILSVEDDGPADTAGIEAGDTITHINGKKYAEYTDNELDAMFSKENNELKLTIQRPDGNEYEIKDVLVKIQKVSRQSVFVTDFDGIMYIRITQFDEDTGEEFKIAIDKIKKMQYTGMIIDLRDNGGGYEIQADMVADRILPEGLIAYAEDKNGKRVAEIKSDAECIDVPMVVLVNEHTASASELVTGAIRDFKRATIVGKKTFGKALGQARWDFLEDGSGILITTARYFTPSGECIHGVGISPDVEVGLPEKYNNVYIDEIPLEEDTQLQKAFEILKK